MSSANYASLSRATQTQKARADQVNNNAGGYVFQIEPIKQLERFLILGSDKPTYYQTAQALTRENAAVVEAMWATQPQETMQLIYDITVNNRAPKKSPALFAMALGTLSTNDEARNLVYSKLHSIAKTGSQLMEFVDYTERLGKGWGRGLKRAVGQFYDRKDLPYQLIKYRNRNGFNHKRLLQLSHPKNLDGNIAKWILGKDYDPESLPEKIQQFEAVQKNPALASEYSDLPWEAFPTEALNDVKLWKALLPNMPIIALVRNLGKMSSIGLLKPLSAEEAIVVEKLKNPRGLHPFNIMIAMKTYQSGRGFRGSLNWPVNQNVVAALEDAFYASFQYVKPAGKRTLIGLDVSGSMSSPCQGTSVSAREAAGAMAMSILRTEPRTYIHGFTNQFVDLGITKNDGLAEVQRKIYKSNFGTTDCAVPMVHALQHGLEVDTFVVFTDNETYAGRVHPYQALQDYRRKTGIDAGLVVAAFTSTGFSIADPRDHKSLDIVGLDSALPQLVAQF